MTKTVAVKCPICTSENISKNGHNATGKQVYNCNNQACKRRTFVEEYTYNACKPEIRKQVLKMAVECTGTRATGRILGISKDSVTAILKKMKIGIGK